MKRRILPFLIYLLLGGIFGVVGFTASDYANCDDLLPDEFLDLAFESPNPVSPIFESHPYTHPIPLFYLKVCYFREVNLLTSILRC